MADLSKLRKKIKPVIAATGSTVLVAGLLTSCFPAGNLLPPPMDLVTPEEVVSPPLDWTSGNLMAPDMMEFDAGVQDEGSIPFDFSSGNLMAPDVQALDEGPPPKRGVVRLQKASGSWEFTPLPDGRTRAVCESHTEIGGSIPSWLVDRVSRNTVVEGLVLLRARLDLADDLRTAESGERPVGAIR